MKARREHPYNISVRVAIAEWMERRDERPRSQHSMAVIARKHKLRVEQLKNYMANYFSRKNR